MPEPKPHALWLLRRSRRKAQRRGARVAYRLAGAARGWAAVAGVELDGWQVALLAASFRQGKYSHG